MGTIVARLGVDKIAKNAKFWRLITELKNGGWYLTVHGWRMGEDYVSPKNLGLRKAADRLDLCHVARPLRSQQWKSKATLS